MLQYDNTVDRTPEFILKFMCFNSFIFTLSLTTEIYNKESRVKATIAKAEKINFNTANDYMLSKISKLSA